MGLTAKSKRELAKAAPLTETQELNLEDILKSELKRIYYNEELIQETNVRLLKTAHGEDLQEYYIENQRKNNKRIKRLDQIFSRLLVDVNSIEDHAPLHPLHNKAGALIENYTEGPLKDIILTIYSQQTEYQQVAAYKAACEICEALGYYKIGVELDMSLGEKEQACAELAEILKRASDEAHGLFEENLSPDELMDLVSN